MATGQFLNAELIEIATEFMRAVSQELDPYTSQDGKIITTPTSVTLLTPSHIQFARYGRGPGKKPPLDPILSWVNAKGIQFEGSTKRGTAFAIQASIGKNGTKNWVKGAPNALEEAIQKDFDTYNRRMGDIMATEIHREVDEIVRKTIIS